MAITVARLGNSLAGRGRKYFFQPIALLLQRATRARRIAAYLAATASPALILGAGAQRRAGWLATDLAPENRDMLYVDAARRLPFDDASFAFVFAEHMFEHVPYGVGVELAREVLRILRPGGVFRIATPDLQAIARIALPPLDAAAQRYVDASNELFGEHVGNGAAFVVNRVFRWWGHEFIYDQQTLVDLLERTGFAGFVRCRMGESGHAPLAGLEHHGGVVGQDMNLYETMVLEATKPGTARG